jgi:O-antigen/teichoic acid export membrane protein
LVFAGLVIGLANEIPLALIQAQQKSALYSILSVGRFSLSLGLNILFIVGLGWGILGIILSSVIIQSVFCLFLMGYTLRWSGLHFSIPKLKLLMRYGLPFIPSGIGLFAMNFADRFFLQRFAGLSEVGIYSLGYKFGMILNPLITSPYQTIFRPKMFELSKRDDAKEINSLLFTYFMFIEVFAGLGIAVLIKDALIYISDPEYHTAYIVVPFIVLSYIFNAAYIHAQVGLLITKTTKYVAYIVASSALVNLTLNFLLIRHIGMWGAVISTVSSFGLMYVLTIILSRNVYHVHYQWFRVAKMFVLGGVMYWVSLRISLDSVILSLLLKTVFVLTFPLWLFVLGFYTPKETGKMKELAKQAAQAFQRKIGRSESPS